jgi:molecular chaperone HtpG
VADRLQQTLKADRKDYESKWNDLKLFINYGMLSQEDFYDRAKDFALLEDVEGKFFTFDEYKTLIKDNQTDKNGDLIYLYATNKVEQYSYLKSAESKGYSVLALEGQLDVPMVSMLEQKLEKSRLSRIDADILDHRIVKEAAAKTSLSDDERDKLSEVFRSQMPKVDKAMFNVEVEALGEQSSPVVITQDEYMRRMKDMSQFQPGMSFYGQMPDSYKVVLNADHALVKDVLDKAIAATAETLKPVEADLKGTQAREAALLQTQGKMKPEKSVRKRKTTCRTPRRPSVS